MQHDRANRYGEAKKKSWDLEMGYANLEPNLKKAQKKLKDYYKSIGFKNPKNKEYFVGGASRILRKN